MATTINLRDYYYWCAQDVFVEVSDEVAAELLADQRHQKSHEQRLRRNLSFYSLDKGDGIETSAIVSYNDNPERVLDMMERFCRLCRALNSLPEIQARRVESHYLRGMDRKEIAAAEGVSVSSVQESIDRGLQAMKKFFKKF